MNQLPTYLNRSNVTDDDHLIYDSSMSEDISVEEIQTIMNSIREFTRGEITEDQAYNQISNIQITFRFASLFDQYFFGQSGSLWREAYNRPASGTFYTFDPSMVDNFDDDNDDNDDDVVVDETMTWSHMCVLSPYEIRTILQSISDLSNGVITEQQAIDNLYNIEITYDNAVIFDTIFYGRAGPCWRCRDTQDYTMGFFTFSDDWFTGLDQRPISLSRLLSIDDIYTILVCLQQWYKKEIDFMQVATRLHHIRFSNQIVQLFDSILENSKDAFQNIIY
jgi:hypothetical protein